MYRKSGSFGMAKSYYSTIFEHSADEVWNVIRDFNNYPVWVDGAGESEIESGKSGDSLSGTQRSLRGQTDSAKTPGHVRCRKFTDLRVCRRGVGSGARLPGHIAGHAGR